MKLSKMTDTNKGMNPPHFGAISQTAISRSIQEIRIRIPHHLVQATKIKEIKCI